MDRSPQVSSRRHFLKASGLMTATLFGGTALISACGSNGQNPGSSSSGHTSGPATSSPVTQPSTASGDSKKARLTLALNWLVDYGFLGEVVALEKGYYDEAGVNLTILPGGPSIDPNQLLGAGTANLSEGSSSAAMMARSAGVPLKAIAAVSQGHPYAYFSLPKDPVHAPKDLVGKTIGLPNTGLPILEAVLAANGIARSDVKTVTVGNDFSALASGRVQVMTGYYTSLQAQRAALGDDYVVMKLDDAGVHLYAYMYSAREDILESQSDALQDLLVASSRGWQFARENPDEAVDILVKYNPANKKEPQLDSTKLLEPLVWGPDTKTNGWGWMSDEKWKQQLDLYKKIGQFKSGAVPTVDEIMSLEILKATADQRVKG